MARTEYTACVWMMEPRPALGDIGQADNALGEAITNLRLLLLSHAIITNDSGLLEQIGTEVNR